MMRTAKDEKSQACRPGDACKIQISAPTFGEISLKLDYSDPRLPIHQITTKRYFRVQITELYKMRPEPKKGRQKSAKCTLKRLFAIDHQL